MNSVEILSILESLLSKFKSRPIVWDIMTDNSDKMLEASIKAKEIQKEIDEENVDSDGFVYKILD